MSDLLLYIPILAVSFLIYLFTFWKSLKDDYIPSQIFSTAVYTVFFVIVGYTISTIVPTYRFWLIIGFFILGYTIGAKQKGIKYFEGLDSILFSVLLALIFSGIILVKYWQIQWILFYITVILAAGVYILIKKYYKSFIWYRSGKRGFSALFTIGTFFLIRSMVSIVKPDLTLMLTEYDIFISGLISLISFLNIFIIAR